MSDYTKLTKPELVEEIKKRRAAGSKIAVDLRSDEATLVASLEMDDLAGDKANDEDEGNQLDKEFVPGSIENQLSAAPEIPSGATQPDDEAFSKGFKARDKQGIIFQVIKDPTDELKPYKARVPKQASGHPGLYWEGSKEEYNETFEKL